MVRCEVQSGVNGVPPSLDWKLNMNEDYRAWVYPIKNKQAEWRYKYKIATVVRACMLKSNSKTYCRNANKKYRLVKYISARRQKWVEKEWQCIIIQLACCKVCETSHPVSWTQPASQDWWRGWWIIKASKKEKRDVLSVNARFESSALVFQRRHSCQRQNLRLLVVRIRFQQLGLYVPDFDRSSNA